MNELCDPAQPRTCDNRLVGDYLSDIQCYPLLSAEQERALGERVQHGDRSARTRFINSNLRLVVAMAKKYKHTRLSLIELISAGNQGLIKAVEGFEPRKGCRFSTFAHMWIRDAIETEIARNACIAVVPQRTLRQLRQLYAAKQADPNQTYYQCGEALGIKRGKVDWLLRAHHQDSELYAPGYTDDYDDGRLLGREFEQAQSASLLEDERQADESHAWLTQLLGALPPNQAVVLAKYYGLQGHRSHTLAEIGAPLGISAERIRQVKEQALKKIRAHLRAAGINADDLSFPESTTA